MRLFDAHTHIDMRQFQNDRETVITRAKNAGLEGMVTSSIGPGSFRRTLGLVQKHEGFIHHSAGCGVSRLVREDAEKIIALTRKYADQIVAIGEVGLDYHWVKDSSARKGQEPLFQMFIDLAAELNLPIVIHSRKAELEATQILEREFDGAVLMHCFDGSPEVAKRVRDNGWFITLPANFSRYQNRVQAARIIPLEQIMLETDGPYLSPTDRRNEPANIVIGVEKLANLLELQDSEVGAITAKNAIGFYGL